MLQKPKPCGVKKQTEAARKSCIRSVSGQVSQKADSFDNLPGSKLFSKLFPRIVREPT